MAPVLRVVAHEVTRTGAPTVLLELLRHLRENSSWSIQVEQTRGGALARELAAIGDSGAVGTAPDVILINGSSAAPSLLEADPDIPAVVYVHEDEEGLSTLSDLARRALVERADLTLCVSIAARSDLIAIGVAPDHVEVMPPVVVARQPPSSDEVAAARARLGAPGGVRLVAACGEAAWHKGPDLFVALARLLSHRKDLQFVWIGRRPRGLGRTLDLDLEALHLSERVHWIGEVTDPAPLLGAADVLVSTSRRDAQPLAPLEAAVAGTPTVGFDIGGLADFARVGAVLTVGYPDTDALASLTVRVLDSLVVREGLLRSSLQLIESSRRLAMIGPQFTACLDRALHLRNDRTGRTRT